MSHSLTASLSVPQRPLVSVAMTTNDTLNDLTLSALVHFEILFQKNSFHFPLKLLKLSLMEREDGGRARSRASSRLIT